MKPASILFIVLPVLISSCSPSIYFENTRMNQVVIEVLKPAETSVSLNIQNVLLLTGNPEDNVNISVEGDITFWDTLPGEIKDNFMINTRLALKQILNEGPRFFVKDTADFYFNDLNQVSWNEVEKLCEETTTDGIILLDRQKILVNSDIAPEYVSDYYGEEIHGATVDITAECNWKIFDPINRKLERRTVKINDDYYSRGSNVDEALDGLPSFDEILDRFSFLSGEKYGNMISPVWVPVTRYYYVSGNSDMKKATRHMASGEWQKAFDIWREYTGSSKQALAKHASFNTILSYEIDGDLETALMWANNTSLRFNSIEAKSYAELLAQRLEEKRMIDEQMGW